MIERHKVFFIGFFFLTFFQSIVVGDDNITALLNKLVYNPNTNYPVGQAVMLSSEDSEIYTSKKDVPAAADGSNAPLGVNDIANGYWGDSASTTDDLVDRNPGFFEQLPQDINTTELSLAVADLANQIPNSNVTDTIQIFSISTRAYFGPNGMSGSLNMEGNNNDPKKVMFRVKGPSMNISGTKLANPSMDVKSKSVSAATWTDEFVSKNFGDHSSATGPYKDRNTGNDLEPMVVTSFTPNVYGCVVGSENGGEGNAIIEIYSLDDDSSSSYFTSLSTRGYYGANGMSGSVNLVGTGKMKVMFRVKGPSMNISGTKLADPNLTLYHSVPNEDTADPDDTKWSQVVQSSTFLSYTGENTSYTNLTSSYTDRHTGNNLEPMVVYELSEGIYGCVVGSDNNGQGNAIIEIYSLE